MICAIITGEHVWLEEEPATGTRCCCGRYVWQGDEAPVEVGNGRCPCSHTWDDHGPEGCIVRGCRCGRRL